MQLQTNGRMCTSRLKDHSSQIGKLSFISASTKTITLIVENSPVYQCLLADTNVSSLILFHWCFIWFKSFNSDLAYKYVQEFEQDK